VTDQGGNTAYNETQITIYALPQVTTVTPNPTFGYVSDTISFNCAATGGKDPKSYAWTFGDNGTGKGQSTPYVCKSAGTFPVTCTVTDAGGKTASGQTQVPIYLLPKVNTVTATPTEGYVGDTISFNCVASGGKGTLTYSWTFGDNGTGKGQSTPSVYNSTGTFTVRCTVTDQGSPPKTAYKEIQVTIYALPQVTGGGSILLILGVIALIVVALIVLLFILSKKKKKAQPPVISSQVTAQQYPVSQPSKSQSSPQAQYPKPSPIQSSSTISESQIPATVVYSKPSEKKEEDGTTLIQRLREKEKNEKKKEVKFDAYKSIEVSGQNIPDTSKQKKM
jgi:PKD repeat protein